MSPRPCGPGRRAIVALWEELGADGPTFGQQIDVDEEAVRRGYLRPLALMLERALGGSAVHLASYREARVAYLPKALDGEQRAQSSRRAWVARRPGWRSCLTDRVEPARTGRRWTRCTRP